MWLKFLVTWMLPAFGCIVVVATIIFLVILIVGAVIAHYDKGRRS